MAFMSFPLWLKALFLKIAMLNLMEVSQESSFGGQNDVCKVSPVYNERLGVIDQILLLGNLKDFE
jgi:hypothetical protein